MVFGLQAHLTFMHSEAFDCDLMLIALYIIIKREA